MGSKFADRAFISLNGIEVLDVQSARLSFNKSRQRVSTMTRNGQDAGFVEGNQAPEAQFSVAIRKLKGLPPLQSIDFGTNSVALVFEVGGNFFLVTDGWIEGPEIDASRVGGEATASYTFHGLALIDQHGSNVTDDIVLAIQDAGGVPGSLGL